MGQKSHMKLPLTKKHFSINRLSLLHRFFFASLFVLPLFIVLSGTTLLNTFEHSQLNAEQEKLQAQLYSLLSVTEVSDHGVILPEAFAEPRFNQTQSGLYALIIDDSQTELWRSQSALFLPDTILSQPTSFKLNQRFFSQKYLSSNNTTLNILSYDTEWIDINNKSHALRFIIMQDAAPFTAEINGYRSRLWQWLGFMGLGLILSQLLIMRWGLQPLKRLSNQLHQLQKNAITQISSNYPSEIQPIITNFNTIFSQEKQQRDRYRNTMSDLAHSVKTPLAVIQSQLSTYNNDDKIIQEQVTRINQIIGHQLQRAVIRVNQSPINHNTNKIVIRTVVDRLLKIISKVYQDKNVHFSNLCHEDSVFFGDESDLLEVLGNIIDNACKHGNNAVTITTENNQDQLIISISDNGQGIAQNMSQTILERGARADTAQPGQGIGLSVAVDIISSYGGAIAVKNNVGEPHLSGACFSISFEAKNN